MRKNLKRNEGMHPIACRSFLTDRSSSSSADEDDDDDDEEGSNFDDRMLLTVSG